MRTRIIATVGPACAKVETLRQMMRQGVSVFRFNFSHGTMEQHEQLLERIRLAHRRVSKPVAILQDLEGHRIRTGKLQRGQPVMLKTGQQFLLYREQKPGNSKGASLGYAGSFDRMARGHMIYIEDGNIHLRVLRSTKDRIVTVIVQGGLLGERKGVNIPGAHLEFPPISTKDLADLSFTLRHRVEYVAQSFVRNAADVNAVKQLLAHTLPDTQVIAKIENREGVKNLAGILRTADGIMVARGDLGISLPIYEIPILQKWIIAACNHLKKPVITATQMLEHMMEHRQPTRAEVSDVANAVIDGSDFVMLSGETATGRYPVETVQMMRTIIEYTEHHAPYRGVRRTR